MVNFTLTKLLNNIGGEGGGSVSRAAWPHMLSLPLKLRAKYSQAKTLEHCVRLVRSPDEEGQEGGEEGHVQVALGQVLFVHAFVVPAPKGQVCVCRKKDL